MRGVWEIRNTDGTDSEALLAGALRLAVADKRGAVNDEAAEALGVRFVINLGGPDMGNALSNDGITYLNIRVEDKEDATLPLQPCLDFISEAIQQRTVKKELPFYTEPCTLLIQCRGAYSRSLSIAAASIVSFSGHHRSLGETLDLIVCCRGLEGINDGFRAQLTMSFDKKKKSKKKKKKK